MAFVYEKVKEEDRELFYSLGIKNCWGDSPLSLPRKWCIDRERNAYLIGIGGGYKDMPYFYDLWWNGYIIRIEYNNNGTNGNYDTMVNVVWNILRIPVPEELWEQREDIVLMIKDAFSVDPYWVEIDKLKSITVNMKCEPELVKGGK